MALGIILLYYWNNTQSTQNTSIHYKSYLHSCTKSVFPYCSPRVLIWPPSPQHLSTSQFLHIYLLWGRGVLLSPCYKWRTERQPAFPRSPRLHHGIKASALLNNIFHSHYSPRLFPNVYFPVWGCFVVLFVLFCLQSCFKSLK